MKANCDIINLKIVAAKNLLNEMDIKNTQRDIIKHLLKEMDIKNTQRDIIKNCCVKNLRLMRLMIR